jgi:hypothetical protein
LDFDVVAVGLSKKSTVNLSNMGNNDAYFHWYYLEYSKTD